jgi:hypothetical protein
MRWLTLRSGRLFALLLEARRSRHSTAYSIPIIAVIAIAGVRLLFGAELAAELPFTTYFPAIVVAALLGGLGPGLVATLLVSMIAWYPTIPGEFGPEAGIWFLLLVLVTAVNILIVALLAAAVELSVDHKNEREPAE